MQTVEEAANKARHYIKTENRESQDCIQDCDLRREREKGWERRGEREKGQGRGKR